MFGEATEESQLQPAQHAVELQCRKAVFLLEEDRGAPQNIGMGKGILDKTPELQETKVKIDSMQ